MNYDNPLLIGAVIVVLMGKTYHDDFEYYTKFICAMEVYDYNVKESHHVIDRLVEESEDL